MVNTSVLSECVELKHSPLAMPVITVARTTFGHRCVICNCVPMRSFGTSRLHINSTGTPSFRGLFWYPQLGWIPHVNNGTQPNSQPNRGTRIDPLISACRKVPPDNSKELKNSTGYDVICYCPLAYLQIDIL
ncbi:hypothetical protein AVEN_252805-1 [Araneus ventricosus]|uniref:Uncharacterized protein n=1 Tax=Araneus ventricosus TaxID=182803 RepID=A0A4Y2CNG7_ARAVE|nr:hypothetical protein AVEN_252805-1 [Araneus ventricosus]